MQSDPFANRRPSSSPWTSPIAHKSYKWDCSELNCPCVSKNSIPVWKQKARPSITSQGGLGPEERASRRGSAAAAPISPQIYSDSCAPSRVLDGEKLINRSSSWELSVCFQLPVCTLHPWTCSPIATWGSMALQPNTPDCREAWWIIQFHLTCHIFTREAGLLTQCCLW